MIYTFVEIYHSIKKLGFVNLYIKMFATVADGGLEILIFHLF